MCPISKPKPVVLLIVAVVTFACILAGFIFPIYLELQAHVYVNNTLTEVSQAMIEGDSAKVAEGLQAIEDKTGFRIFNDYAKLSGEEFFAGIMAARRVVIQEWQRLFQFAVGLTVWYVIFALLVAALIVAVSVYSGKGWRVRGNRIYGNVQD
jgi:hypothetical protein